MEYLTHLGFQFLKALEAEKALSDYLVYCSLSLLSPGEKPNSLFFCTATSGMPTETGLPHKPSQQYRDVFQREVKQGSKKHRPDLTR